MPFEAPFPVQANYEQTSSIVPPFAQSRPFALRLHSTVKPSNTHISTTVRNCGSIFPRRERFVSLLRNFILDRLFHNPLRQRTRVLNEQSAHQVRG